MYERQMKMESCARRDGFASEFRAKLVINISNTNIYVYMYIYI